MNLKFDKAVNKILEEAMSDYLKAAAKTAIKAPLRGAGYLAKKAIDPRTYLKGAGAVAGGLKGAISAPGAAVNALRQGLVYGPNSSGDITNITNPVLGGAQKALAGAEKGITRGIQGAKSSIDTQLQKDQMKKLYGTSDFQKNAQIFDVNYFMQNPSIYKSSKQPNRLARGDIFSIRSKYGGSLQPYRVIDNKKGILTVLPANKI
jgi:hypothetical protein